MRLFMYEVRKIWTWPVLFIIVVVNVLLFKLFIAFDLTYFPNGRPALDHFVLEQQMIPLFGTSWDDEEWASFQRMYDDEVAAANAYLASDPQAIAAGLDTYDKLNNYDVGNAAQNRYHDLLFFEREEPFAWRLQAFQWYMTEYEYREASIKAYMRQVTPNETKRLQHLLENEQFTMYSKVVLSNFDTYKTSVAIVIFISVALLISPLFIRDKLANVEPIQYATAKGRKLYRTKWWAGLGSGTLLTMLLLAIYMTLYATNDTQSHFDLPLSTFGASFHWYDMTFWQYIMLSVALLFLLAVVLTILTMAISTAVSTWIMLIAVQIVVLFIMIAVGAAFVVQHPTDLTFAQWLMPVLIVSFIVSTGVLTRHVWFKVLRRDII